MAESARYRPVGFGQWHHHINPAVNAAAKTTRSITGQSDPIAQWCLREHNSALAVPSGTKVLVTVLSGQQDLPQITRDIDHLRALIPCQHTTASRRFGVDDFCF